MPFLRAVGSEYLHEASPPACLSFAARIKGRETVVKAEGRVAEMSPVSKDNVFQCVQAIRHKFYRSQLINGVCIHHSLVVSPSYNRSRISYQ